MYSTKILKDSLNLASGNRLTTWELSYPRFIHAEIMTHRAACLAGDSILEFDLPGGNTSGGRRVHPMRLDEFVDKWHNGARRIGAKPKRASDLSWIDDGKKYTSHEVAAYLGMPSTSNIHKFCREGILKAEKHNNTWYIEGSSVREWRQHVPAETRFDMQARLRGMHIRQLNERTGDISTANVVDAIVSGVKPVYEVIAGDFTVAGSKDHRILTADGWKTISELTTDDFVVVRKHGKREEERLDPLRLQKIDGRWRSTWQNQERARLQAEDSLCRRCQARPGTDVHHNVAVYIDPSRAFDRTNITLLCEPCHDAQHDTQGWQEGFSLYGGLAKIDSIEYRGEEPTYDLTISGEDPNFLANGIVVHNSRNAASSRAIPITKMINRVIDDPAMPVFWGKNQPGMQAEVELDTESIEKAKVIWLDARDNAIESVKQMIALGVHKQIANRLLEPWMFITVIFSMTEHENFYFLRDHPKAQPEFTWVARDMRIKYNAAKPTPLHPGEWHLPLIDDHELAQLSLPDAKKVSVGRCARVSYLTHDGVRDFAKDIELHDKLCAGPLTGEPGHWSPFEHVAMATETAERSGNFTGFHQYRKEFAGENYTGKHLL